MENNNMYFNDEYQNLIYTAKDLREEYGKNLEIQNYIIKDIDIELGGHFHYAPTISIETKVRGFILPQYNQVANIGFVMFLLFDFFYDRGDDNWNSIKKLNNIPIRVVYDDYKVIGIGHYLEDRFILIKDFMSYKGKQKEDGDEKCI